MSTLFDDEYPVDNSPIEKMEIVTTMVYFEKKELKTFKQLCKTGMSKMYQDEVQQKGNLSDFLLAVVKKYNEDTAI